MDWKRLKGDPGLWQTFRLREKIIDKIREFFKNEGFLEVQTPILCPALIPESYLEVFETELKDKLGIKKRAFLSPSPELWLKRLLAAGSGNIFEITKSFRNTDIGGHQHNPEFTMLEWYRTDCDYRATMEDCEKLIRFIGGNKPYWSYRTDKIYKIDVSKPFERVTVAEAFERYAGVKKEVLLDPEQFNNLAIEQYNNSSLANDYETAFSLFYVDKIEPNLGWGQPTIIYDYPAQFAPLAKTSKEDSRIKERFELYLAGVEIADAYNELTDPIEQKKRFEEEIESRKKTGKTGHKVDWGFIEALEEGLPNCSGVALGIDRLLMVLADKKDINEVILFGGEEIFDAIPN